MSLLLLMDDSFLPYDLFRANEQGIWLDPSDFSTMFQDSAGTTPVTATGQPVGLELDKRLGLALGAENITSQDLTNAAWVSGGAFGNWAGSTATATTITTTGTDGARRFRFPCTPGQAFKATCSAVKGGTATGASINIIFGTAAAALIGGSITSATNLEASSAPLQVYGIAPATAAYCEIAVRALGVSGSQATFTNISVRELAGNHAYQTTAASRPTVQSGYNAFDKTDDHLLVAAGGAGTTGFLLACGIVVPAAGTARTIFSDRGTDAGYSLGIDATNKVVFSGGTGAAFTTLTSANALTAGQKYAVIAWHDGTNLNLSINNVAETPVACGTVTAGTATFTIGKDNGAASGYWGDRLYSMVYRKNDTSNAGNRSNLFSYLVGKMGGL